MDNHNFPQVINVSGSNLWKAMDIVVQWSIGELALVNEMDSPDSSYILTNGFIQPEDTIVSVPFKSTPVIFKNIQFSSARHSAVSQSNSRYFEIKFFQNISGKISLQLYNEVGNIVYQREILAHGSRLTEKINMKGFTNGIYILYIKSLNFFPEDMIWKQARLKLLNFNRAD